MSDIFAVVYIIGLILLVFFATVGYLDCMSALYRYMKAKGW